MLKIGKQSASQIPPSQATTQTVWREIKISDDASFEVLLKRPTFEDLLADEEEFRGYTEKRLKRCLLNWRGVQGDDGSEILFSFEALKSLSFAFPLALKGIIVELNLLYAGISGDDSKNSQTLSAESSRAANETSQNSVTPETVPETAIQDRQAGPGTPSVSGQPSSGSGDLRNPSPA